MIDILVYLGKVAILLIAFYGLYRLFLGNETLFRWNRAVLLGTALFSFILPLITIRIQREVPAQLPEQETAFVASQQQPALSVSGEALSPVPAGSTQTDLQDSVPIKQSQRWLAFSWPSFLGILFVLGALFVILRLAISFFGLMRILRKSECVIQTPKCRVYVTDEPVIPFCWMRTIVLTRADWEGEKEMILAHEKAHVQLGHSYDRIVMDLMTVLQWFNPVIWLIREELLMVHDFEADENVLESGFDSCSYQHLLVRKAVGEKRYSVANSLIRKSLKRRVMMMYKSKSRPETRMRALYIIPLAAIALAMGCKTVYVPATIPSEPLPPTADTLFVVHDPARDAWAFEGGAAGFDKSRNVVGRGPYYKMGGLSRFALYVQEGVQTGISVKRKKTVQVSFVIRTDGTMSDPRIWKSGGRKLDAAALGAVASVPYKDWLPGTKQGVREDVTIVFPVVFTPRVALSNRLLRDKYRHPLDTIRYVWNTEPSHSPLPIKGFLVDDVFHRDLKAQDLTSVYGGKEPGSSWIVADSLTLAKYGLAPGVGIVCITTKEYEAIHGRPAEVVEREKAEATPRDPRPSRQVFRWVPQGGERLDSLPSFQGKSFDQFERWTFDHGEIVRQADPKEYGSSKVCFVVDTDGRIRSPHMIEGLSEAYDRAVLELLLNSPVWEPALKNGKAVPVAIVCTLCFNPLIK